VLTRPLLLLPAFSNIVHNHATIHTLRLTISQLVSLGVEPHLRLMTRYLLLFNSYGLVFLWRPLWRVDGFVFYICCWPSPAWSFSRPSPLGLVTIFYCLKFETSLFIASYDSQGHGGGIRTRLRELELALYRRCTDRRTQNTVSSTVADASVGVATWSILNQSIGATWCLATGNTLPIVACSYFGRGLEMNVILLLRASRSRGVYRDVA
jgi:hypothetical protein